MTDNLRAQLQAALGDTYQLSRELGGGGMSRVFVARDESLGRDVVIKVLAPDLAASLSADRFTREIRLAATLQEPHIVPLLAAGTTADGVPWYTMPFVQGNSLRSRMQAGPLPASESLGILRNISQALAYAHERDIVHRDIKPENVLLSSGTAVVTDFGIAKALSASTTQGAGATLTSVGTSIGTPAYMAPEQAVGDASTDYRADIYAWGVVAYELLSGAHPFANRSSPQALVTAHLTEQPAQLAAAGVPDAIRVLVMQSLAKDPAHRPANAREIIRVLDSSFTPVEMHPAALPQPQYASPRALRRTAVLVAIGGVIVAGGILAAIARSHSAGAGAGTSDKSIAVLPFENATRDTAQEYFVDGLTEELIGRLAAAGMRVTGRNSVFTYKGQHPAPRAIGTSLRVGSVMTGSVRRAGDRLLVSAELANTSSDSVMWSFSVDRPATAILTLQKELVDSIANRFRLSSPAERRAESSGTRNLAAREAYIRGRYLYYKFTRQDLSAAITAFDEASRLDPNYALPHVGKAIALGWLADGFVAPSLVTARIRDELALAMKADSSVAEAWSASAVFEVSWGWNWAAARHDLDRALSLNGGDSDWYFAETIYRVANGDYTGTVDALAQAHRLDPFSPGVLANSVFLPFLTGHAAAARELYRSIPPNMLDAMNYGDALPAMILEAMGQRAAAESSFVHAETIMGHRSPALGIFYLHTSRPDSARRVLADIERKWSEQYIPPELVARLPAALADTTTMYKWLERGLTARSAWAPYLSVMMLEFSPYRAQQHFRSILSRIGVKDGTQQVSRNP